ncbi:hypothetical protein JCM8208_006279 [Rhodotorula glutinis]
MVPTAPAPAELPPSSPSQRSPDPSSPRPRTRSRTSSIRRKPVSYLDTDDVELLAVQDAATRATDSWQLRTLDGHRGSDTGPPSPAPSSTSHAFPPLLAQAQPPASASSSALSTPAPPASSLDPSPSTSSYPRPYVDPPPSSRTRTPHADGDNPFATLSSSRRSLRSQRSSVGDESVFGTAPVGVIGHTRPREVIRVERDYSAGETCQMWSGWIWELEGRVSPTDYQNALNEINEVLASAHDPTRSILDNLLAVVTLYLSPLVLSSHYQREMRRLRSVLERLNRDLFNPAGLNLLSPLTTAFLFSSAGSDFC